jgi:hypothetical protein
MRTRMRGPSTTGMSFLSILLLFSLISQAEVPKGWILAGSKPADYESGIDLQAEFNGHASVLLRAKKPAVDGFATLMQQFRADDYHGKRVRFSGFVKATGLQDWAGLWMRVDKGTRMVAFDNMHDRPITSADGWQKYEVVLDVPQDATGIAFGILLKGSGSAWLNHPQLEVVGNDIPTTGPGLNPATKGPASLDVEN